METEKITYQQIKEELSTKLDVTLDESDDLLKDIIFIIREGLGRDEQVYIPKFGVFELQAMESRRWTNPQTGETSTIPAHKRVVFKPRKALRSKVNKKFKNLESYPVENRQEPVKQRVSPWVWVVLGVIIIAGGVVFYEPQYAAHISTYEVKDWERDTTTKSESKISPKTKLIDITKYELKEGIAKGNHLYQLSRELYQDPKYWPLLFFANYSELHNPDKLPPLDQMRVYEVDVTSSSSLSSKDSVLLSVAYGVVSASYYMHGNFRQYRAYKKRSKEFKGNKRI